MTPGHRRGLTRNRGGPAAIVVAALALGLSGPPGRGDEPYSKLPAPASALLDGAEAIEILSIDPKGRPAEPGEGFHGWRVLGRTTLRDPGTRKSVVAALRRGIAEAEGAAGCFEPRHGLRATKGDRSADFVICFSCRWIEVHADGERASVWISESPKPAINHALRDAGVALAPGSD